MDDNVEMTDRSIQGGFSAVGLPRAINRRGGPKEGEKGGSRWKWKRREGEGSVNEERRAGVSGVAGCIRLRNINTVRAYASKKKKCT